jgi:hypothetical protein
MSGWLEPMSVPASAATLHTVILTGVADSTRVVVGVVGTAVGPAVDPRSASNPAATSPNDSATTRIRTRCSSHKPLLLQPERRSGCRLPAPRVRSRRERGLRWSRIVAPLIIGSFAMSTPSHVRRGPGSEDPLRSGPGIRARRAGAPAGARGITGPRSPASVQSCRSSHRTSACRRLAR